MVIKLVTIKKFTWFIAVLFLVIAFPIQVYTASPLPSLIPYLIIFLLYGIIIVCTKKIPINIRPLTKMNLFVIFYVIYFLINIFFEFINQKFALEKLVTNIILYILPVFFFFYFRKKASEIEIKWVFYGIITASIFCGIFFAYDSYNKFALRKTTDYSNAAYEYSLKRSNQTSEEANEARLRVGFKSFGLLETHSVSGTWLLLGLYASLTLTTLTKTRNRILIILFFGLFLFIGLNFTSILTFIISILLFEFQLISILFGKISKKLILNLSILFTIIFLILFLILSTVGDVMSTSIIDLISIQLDFLFGSNNIEVSQSTILSNKLVFFSEKMLNNPWNLIFGNISQEGKGGDMGFFDTINTFGLTFYIIFWYGLYKILKSSVINFRQTYYHDNKLIYVKNIVHFNTFIIALIFLTDLHYSVWNAKSVFPIIFFSLALYDRYINIKL